MAKEYQQLRPAVCSNFLVGQWLKAEKCTDTAWNKERTKETPWVPRDFKIPCLKVNNYTRKRISLDSNPVYLPTLDVGISVGETLWMPCYGSMCHSDLDSVWQCHLGQGRKDNRTQINYIPFSTGPTVERRYSDPTIGEQSSCSTQRKWT